MAAWTPPTILPVNSVLPSTAWNNLANDATFLYQKPMTSVFDSVGTSIPSGADTVVTTGGLAGTAYSSYGWSNNNNTLIVPQAGIYAFSFRVGFVLTGLSLTTGGGFAQLFTESGLGGQTAGSWVSFTSTSAPFIVNVSIGSCLLPCSAGEGIYLVAYQINNGGVTVETAVGAVQTGIDAIWLGSL